MTKFEVTDDGINFEANGITAINLKLKQALYVNFINIHEEYEIPVDTKGNFEAAAVNLAKWIASHPEAVAEALMIAEMPASLTLAEFRACKSLVGELNGKQIEVAEITIPLSCFGEIVPGSEMGGWSHYHDFVIKTGKDTARHINSRCRVYDINTGLQILSPMPS